MRLLGFIFIIMVKSQTPLKTEVHADYWGCSVNVDYEVIRSDYPELLPKEKFVVYLRREPFEDPLEV